MKKIYIAVLIIITVVCVALGSAIHIYGAFGGKDNSFLSDKSIVTVDSALDKFENVKTDLNICDLKIEEGTDYHISYECSENLVPEVEVKDGTLTISQKKKVKESWKSKLKCDITITIPEDTKLADMDLITNVGDVDLSNLTVDNFKLDADVGDVDMENCVIGNGNIKADTGDMDFDACSFDTLDLDGDVGDVKLVGLQNISDYGFDIKVDVGDVTVDGEKKKREYIKDEDKDKKITIKVNIGDVKVMK